MCGDQSADLFQLKSLNIRPWPPVKGQMLTVSETGNLKQPMNNGAKAKVVVKVAGFNFLETTLGIQAISDCLLTG
jgi:hypothetical protein